MGSTSTEQSHHAEATDYPHHEWVSLSKWAELLDRDHENNSEVGDYTEEDDLDYESMWAELLDRDYENNSEVGDYTEEDDLDYESMWAELLDGDCENNSEVGDYTEE